MKKKSRFHSGPNGTQFGTQQQRLLHSLALTRSKEMTSAFQRALALHQAGRLTEAEAIYGQILKVEPNHFDASHLLGVIYYQRGTHADAVRQIDAALKVNSKFADAHANRGNALLKLGSSDEALVSYDKALALTPNKAETISNRGFALYELKRFDEALASYERALALQPEHAGAHWNEALLRLLKGDFGRGWAKHEWRWANKNLALKKRNFAQPLWLGSDAIANKTILLYSEQGFGDTIQFCRYVPLVAERNARVILEVPSSLHGLMCSLAGPTQTVSYGSPLPHFDFQCPLLTLPLAFGTRLETIPSATPYLRASADSLKNWQTRLGPRSRPRIGLVWSGSPTHTNDKVRSISLQSLQPLLDIDATFVSLQKDVRSDDAPLLKKYNDILDFGDLLKDFSDTAALISHLDLVISVDTSVAHVAGALAKPVWVLLPFVPDWRWLLDRDDNPWYPTSRLFRQNRARDWDCVIMRVREALLKFVKYL